MGQIAAAVMSALGQQYALGDATCDGSIAPITAIRPVRPGALLDPRQMGAAVV
jgi:hypothetical protein